MTTPVMMKASIHSEPHSAEHDAKAYVTFVENWGNEVLSNATSKLSAKDQKAFAQRLKNFRDSFDSFSDFVEQMRGRSPNRAEGVYMFALRLIRASVLLGSAGAVSEDARAFHNTTRQQENAKKRRTPKWCSGAQLIVEADLAKGGDLNSKAGMARCIRRRASEELKSILPEDDRAIIEWLSKSFPQYAKNSRKLTG
jgi:hypothetical protein